MKPAAIIAGLALVALVAASGCSYGAGPVLSVGRGNRVSFGVEAGAAFTSLRSDVQYTVYERGGVVKDAIRHPFSVTAGVANFPLKDVDDQDELSVLSPSVDVGLGAAFGDNGVGFAGHVAPQLMFGPSEGFGCSGLAEPRDEASTLYTISVGIRHRGGHNEIYVAPKVHRVDNVCIH